MMILYHRTTPENAQSILRDGFLDRTGTYLTMEEHTGVWLSNVALDCADMGHLGEALLRVALDLSEEALGEYEWIEDEKTYREWLIPAQIINANSKIELLDEETADELVAERFFGVYSAFFEEKGQAYFEERGIPLKSYLAEKLSKKGTGK